MNKTLRIGTNRGKARIWIEGQALMAQGWKKGDSYHCDFQNGRIAYIKGEDGTRKVAGTDTRPIIDTNTDKIRDSIGKDFSYVKIHVQHNVIVITPAEKPASGFAGAVVALALVVSSIGAPYLSQFKRGAQRVLVACEESATVRDEFVRLGHDAVSCDIMDTRNPRGWHIKGDVRPYLKADWDLVLGFPPCTYVTASAAWAFNDPDYEKYPGVGYHQRISPGTLTGAARRAARDEAIAFVQEIYTSCDRVCVENPKGFLSSMWMKPTQIIQPHQFGDPSSKDTCLWLKGLAPLTPTNELDITEHGWQAPNGTWRWMNQTASGQNNLGPSDDRAKLRSTTFKGIARAMAAQFGGLLT